MPDVPVRAKRTAWHDDAMPDVPRQGEADRLARRRLAGRAPSGPKRTAWHDDALPDVPGTPVTPIRAGGGAWHYRAMPRADLTPSPTAHRLRRAARVGLPRRPGKEART